MKHVNQHTQTKLKRTRLIGGAFVVLALLVLGASLALLQPKSVDALESPFMVTADSLDRVPSAQDGVETFGVLDNQNPAVDSAYMQVLADAIEPIALRADIHFAVVDLDTGHGLAYNIDEAQFGASSFKALYCSYVCQELIDTGVIATDIAESNFVSPYFEIKELMRATVEESNNETYATLVGMLGQYLPNKWLAAWGAYNVASSFGSNGTYPDYSVRESLKLWYETESYFEQSATAASEYLRTLTESTTVSYIRNGIAKTTEGSSVLKNPVLTVRNKAGYSCITDEEPDSLPAIVDAGYVNINGRPYLISVMTTLDCSEGYNRECVEDLIAAMFEALWSMSD